MMAFVIPVVEHWLEQGLFNEVSNPCLGSEMKLQGRTSIHGMMAFVIPVVENWLVRETAQWIPHERSIR